MTVTDEERFWSRVDKRRPGECWPWTGALERSGHPSFRLGGGARLRAHRFALQLSLGRPLLPGAYACHRCNHPWCVNPEHLYEGTAQTNSDDKVAAGRQMRGSRHHLTRLTEEAVAEIVRRYAAGGISQRVLGLEYGVSQSEISRMVNGRSWKHVVAAS